MPIDAGDADVTAPRNDHRDAAKRVCIAILVDDSTDADTGIGSGRLREFGQVPNASSRHSVGTDDYPGREGFAFAIADQCYDPTFRLRRRFDSRVRAQENFSAGGLRCFDK